MTIIRVDRTQAAAALLATILVAAPALSLAEESPVAWGRSTPEDQGVDSLELIRILSLIREQNLDIHSVLISRNGRMLAECYVHPYDKDMLHNVKSVSKSIMSALTGIALREGFIADLDQTVDEFFPQYFGENPGDRRREITLRHLLTMTAGLDLDENGPIESEIYSSDDWIAATLARPLVENPGDRFNYSTPLSHVMSGILSDTSGMSLLASAQRYLFEPLGIHNAQWSSGPQGYSFGGAELFLTPRAMAKFGVLYLNQGRWQDVQIVPAEWVEESTAYQVEVSEQGNEQYGYWWWRRPDGRYHARGWGGQTISIKPDLGLVTVTTAANMGAAAKIFVALARYEPSPEALPPNPQGVEALTRLIHELEHPEPSAVAELPAKAAEISEQTYVLDSNDLALESLSLECGGTSTCTLTLGSKAGTIAAAVGLDGLYRVSNTGALGEMPRDNRLALRGRWIDDHTFAMDYHEIGRPAHWSVDLTFSKDQLRVSVITRPLDFHFELTGKQLHQSP